jgi:hypothetical protein
MAIQFPIWFSNGHSKTVDYFVYFSNSYSKMLSKNHVVFEWPVPVEIDHLKDLFDFQNFAKDVTFAVHFCLTCERIKSS